MGMVGTLLVIQIGGVCVTLRLQCTIETIITSFTLHILIFKNKTKRLRSINLLFSCVNENSCSNLTY